MSDFDFRGVNPVRYANDGTSLPGPGTITNAMLVNDDVTINTSGTVSGGGVVALGGTLNLVGNPPAPASITNAMLVNDDVTINTSGTVSGGGVVALGGTLNLVGNPPAPASITNAMLQNDSITINAGANIGVMGSPVALGGAITISASGGIAEAPIDGNQYARENAAWAIVNAGALALLGDANGPANANQVTSLKNGAFQVRGGIVTNNTGIGENTFLDAATGTNLTAFGQSTLPATTTGVKKTAFGSNLGVASTFGDNLTLIGVDHTTLTNTKHSVSVGVNIHPRAANPGNSQNDVMIGTNIGNSLAPSNVGGDIGIGIDILTSRNFSYNNFCAGHNVAPLLTNGISNIAIGENALQRGVLALENVCLGTNTGNGIIDGAGWVNIGNGAGAAFADLSVGSYNINIGDQAGLKLVSGDNNINIGRSAQGDITILKTGSNNIIIGGNSKTNNSTPGKSNSIIIGPNLIGPNVAFEYTMFRAASVPVYADQAAALAGGLIPGCIFQTATGALFIKN